jgi:hypothetical protein
MCDPGDVCDMRGRCVNPCDGATCPAGQRCDRTERRCVDDVVMPPPREPGPEAGTDQDAATQPTDDGGALDDGGAMDGGAAVGGGVLRRPGCGCRIPATGESRHGGLALAAVALGLGMITARRHRRRHAGA